jgi:hypothetical protein
MKNIEFSELHGSLNKKGIIKPLLSEQLNKIIIYFHPCDTLFNAQPITLSKNDALELAKILIEQTINLNNNG